MKKIKELETACLYKEEDLENYKQQNITMSGDVSRSRGEVEELSFLVADRNKVIEDLQRQVKEQISRSEGTDRIKIENSKLKLSLRTV